MYISGRLDSQARVTGIPGYSRGRSSAKVALRPSPTMRYEKRKRLSETPAHEFPAFLLFRTLAILLPPWPSASGASPWKACPGHALLPLGPAPGPHGMAVSVGRGQRPYRCRPDPGPAPSSSIPPAPQDARYRRNPGPPKRHLPLQCRPGRGAQSSNSASRSPSTSTSSPTPDAKKLSGTGLGDPDLSAPRPASTWPATMCSIWACWGPSPCPPRARPGSCPSIPATCPGTRAVPCPAPLLLQLSRRAGPAAGSCPWTSPGIESQIPFRAHANAGVREAPASGGNCDSSWEAAWNGCPSPSWASSRDVADGNPRGPIRQGLRQRTWPSGHRRLLGQ